MSRRRRRRSYDVYLRSPHWRRFRKAYFAQFPEVCVTCGSDSQIQLHHKTYARLGAERYDDVVPLCRDCHSERHGRRAGRTNDVTVTYADGTVKIRDVGAYRKKQPFPKAGKVAR